MTSTVVPLYYGLSLLGVVVASAIGVFSIALFLSYTRIAALLYLVVILSFVTANSYGYLEAPAYSVYTKGGNTFFFPLVQYYLYGLFIAALYRNRIAHRAVVRGAGSVWMFAFAVLFGCHVAYGVTIGIPLADICSTGGLINVLHLCMIVYVTASAIRDDISFDTAVRILLAVVVLRGCYAIARYLLAGGDPQNAYGNVTGLALKITFWDSSEGLIASLALLYCAGRLIRGWSTISFGMRAVFAGAMCVELIVVLFSYRRTSWYGLLLAAAYFASMLPRNKRAVTAFLALLLALPPVIYLSTARYQKTLRQSNLSLVERIAPDAGASSGISSPSSRFYELYTAFQTVRQHPLIGVGAWGEFEVAANETGLAYHKGNYGFVHSGLGHILLKAGLVGLLLFSGILVSGWRFASLNRHRVPERHLPLFDTCRAGLLFMLPTLLFGGPIVDFRAMALIGILLAVPIALARFETPRWATLPRPSRQRGAVPTPRLREKISTSGTLRRLRRHPLKLAAVNHAWAGRE